MPDNNIFENGWDRKNSYAFGWVMSDGCLRKEGRNKTAYAVRICSNDSDIIRWLHEYMCVGNKIYGSGGKNQTIKFRNTESISFMMNNKLTERKSLSVEFPDVPDETLADFIRGYFDGDGSVVLYETPYNTYGQISFTCGSPAFLETPREKLAEHDIVSHIYKDGRSTNGSYYLRVIKRSELDKLFKYMYSDFEECGYLKRKYEKFAHLLSFLPKYARHTA